MVNSLRLSPSVDQETQTVEVLLAVKAVVLHLLLLASLVVVQRVVTVKTLLVLTSTLTTRRLSQLLLKLILKFSNWS